MKKIFYLLLVLVMCISLVACGSKDEPSGKYYWENSNDTYYQFDNNGKCYLVIDSINARCEYVYAVNKDADEYGTYVVHISDTSSSASHKLVYDPEENLIYDPELGLFKN